MTDTKIKGILGTKLGMTQVFDENNRVVPVTVVKAGPNVVTQIRTEERDGYSAVQLAFGAIDPRKVTKPLTGHFEKAGTTPRRVAVQSLHQHAAPVYDADGHLALGVVALGSSATFSAEWKGPLAQAVLGMARQLSADLGWTGA